MEIAKIAAIGLIAGVLAVTVKKTNPEIAMQVSIAAGIVIFIMIAGQLAEAVTYIKSFADEYQSFCEGVGIVLKVVGIAYIAEFAVQILKDAGEGALSSKVEMAAKVVIMLLTLPLLKDFAEMVFGLL
jgi:stage III sporulation protein AD